MANNIGCLFQGIRDIEGTDMCFFIHRHEVPQDRKVAYRYIVCDIILRIKRLTELDSQWAAKNLPTMAQYSPPQQI